MVLLRYCKNLVRNLPYLQSISRSCRRLQKLKKNSIHVISSIQSIF
uniref:Uncharacterized protein n=1 Tax=Arundo donax TaxID=35708 RepID=A0A0A9AAY1_ARUDO